MSSVVEFKPGCIPGKPDEEIIATIETLLERAKSGDLSSIAYATTSVDGKKGTGWTGIAGTRDPLAAAISMLNHRYAGALLGLDD